MKKKQAAVTAGVPPRTMRVTVELTVTLDPRCKRLLPLDVVSYLDAMLETGAEPEEGSYAVSEVSLVSCTPVDNRPAISVLTSVRGIGEMKAKEVLARFGSLEMIASTSLDDMLKLPAIGKKSAMMLIEAARRAMPAASGSVLASPQGARAHV